MNKQIYTYTSLTKEELNKNLNTSINEGLTTKEAEDRLIKCCANEIKKEQIYWWQIFIRQFQSAFIYLLIIAALVTWFLGERLDSLMILSFVLINSFLGFYQEYKSEKALKMLSQYTVMTVKVKRNNKEILVPAKHLVPGDVVFLETGNIVPADIRLTSETDLIVDETILTGESVAVHKNCSLSQTEVTSIYDAKNIVFSGTSVVNGSNIGVVVATGKQSTFGQIKSLTSEIAKESAFAKGISQFSSFILKLIVLTLIFVVIANILIKGPNANIIELLIFAVALAVSVIPEALPVVTTLSLSHGALKLAKQHVVVKRLSAIEDLGGIEILCTDKTGTITENELIVAESLPFNGENLLLYANLAGAANRETLEPFDKALWQALPEADKKTIKDFKRISELPFDPKRKRNSVLLKNNLNQELFLITRGAPEEIVSLCSNMDKKEKTIFANWIKNQGKSGKRTLSVSIKKLATYKNENLENLENDLQFLGCISFEDPIKESTFEAVKKANRVGVKIKIITGDSLEVSENVAKKIGLLSDTNRVMTATDFIKLPISKQKELGPNIAVFARTDPEQKHYIIKLLQEDFQVGFLGEGINDAPALKVAGVSLVVQSASDIARESADIVLLQKNLEVIIDGIKDGRIIFANTIKYLKATLASNFGNFYAVAISSLLINYLPMLPVQILLLNLLSDFPMISIATDNVDKSETIKPTKYNIKDIVLIATFLGIVSTFFDFMFFGLFYKISPEVLQTNWFIGSILTEIVFMFSIRTHLPFYKAQRPSRSIIFLSAIAGIVTIAIPFTKFGQNIFKFTPPSPYHLALILGLVATYFVCSEVVKNLYYKHERK